ncbi:MAG TPA: OmpA family protein [Burkholderiales bacterium]|nr:OmpA family protein [Burkholderiales bacterium]
MNKTHTLTLAGSAVALVASLSFAQDTKNQGYLVDTYGNNIVTSPTTGLCWRSSDWTPSRAVQFCDPAERKVEIPAPAVVAAAPPPKPAPAPASAPAKVASRNVNFSADALFDFDKSVLKPEGKTLLDDFTRQLGSARYAAILVTGHTDRFGSIEYNQRLSERRANAVKDYLVSKDISVNRIKTEGRGETQPVTSPGDCKGPQSATVIACLQPDRRVRVEVTGTSGPSTISR